MTFPKLPIQWSENGYEITEELGHGSYGSVYKLVKDKGTENEHWITIRYGMNLPRIGTKPEKATRSDSTR